MIDYMEDAKLALDITWELTEKEEQRLSGECRRAEGFLQKRSGILLNFGKEMEDQGLFQLLLDCIRYIHCNALDEFEQNFAEDLMMLRMNAQAEELAGGEV